MKEIEEAIQELLKLADEINSISGNNNPIRDWQGVGSLSPNQRPKAKSRTAESLQATRGGGHKAIGL